ncbi:hypothetical protein COLO4_32118 [Corchorus olitorius]|uniref:Uncharacterized protein n=1 Tax=Corchorus olitorius TaxID=93759 RepID=A0A1R3H165_9ROSI|nr:hypothetical protein COLO4_32118 [Corchorus olitorius]
MWESVLCRIRRVENFWSPESGPRENGISIPSKVSWLQVNSLS